MAANEAKERERGDIGVSVDGTWQKRGFVSLNGVVITISTSNFQVLDVVTMSRYCKDCAAKESLPKRRKLSLMPGRQSIKLIVRLIMPDLLQEWKPKGRLEFSNDQLNNLEFVTSSITVMAIANRLKK